MTHEHKFIQWDESVFQEFKTIDGMTLYKSRFNDTIYAKVNTLKIEDIVLFRLGDGKLYVKVYRFENNIVRGMTPDNFRIDVSDIPSGAHFYRIVSRQEYDTLELKNEVADLKRLIQQQDLNFQSAMDAIENALYNLRKK